MIYKVMYYGGAIVLGMCLGPITEVRFWVGIAAWVTLSISFKMMGRK